jgi:3-oxoacyl-[acyl-carrier protein] reductase
MILRDKTAIVTGGSRGVGRAIAMLLSLEGSYVTICARDIGALRTTFEDIRAMGGYCKYVCADVTKEAQVLNVVDEAMQTFGRVDILVNNAGVGIYKPLSETTIADWHYVMDTNLKGVFLCSKAVIPIMSAHGCGHIVNVASGAGLQGMPNLSLYCASKSGLIRFSESLSQELLELGIRVSHVCLGYTDTDFFKDFPKGYLANRKPMKPEVAARHVLRVLQSDGRQNVGIRGVLKRIVSKYLI